MDEEEFKDNLIEEKEEEQPQNRQKRVISTQKEIEKLKFSDNQHIADLQQRTIRLEYELLYIKDKLFEPSRNKNESQPRLSPYGKLVKGRIN